MTQERFIDFAKFSRSLFRLTGERIAVLRDDIRFKEKKYAEKMGIAMNIETLQTELDREKTHLGSLLNLNIELHERCIRAGVTL